jgi:hypothetical protein
VRDAEDFFLQDDVPVNATPRALSDTHPHLAVEAYGWDPSQFSSGLASWQCSLGHIWDTEIYRRKSGEGCPYCASKTILKGFNDLATTHPQIAMSMVNGDPTQVFAGSGKKYLWKCELGHQWEGSVVNRKKGKGCPFCSNQKILPGFNDLATAFPEVALEAHGWDPTTVSAGSSKGTQEWKCSEGHIWKARVQSRTEPGVMRGCPSCANYGFDPNKKAVLYLLVHAEWDLMKIGIANNMKNRLKEHELIGWELLDTWGPADGLLVYNWEQSILKYVQGNGGDFSARSVAGRAFTGWTECWTQESFRASSIKPMMDSIRAAEGNS